MIYGGKRAPALLFLGDLATFSVALWLTLFLRYGQIPGGELLLDHFAPFSILFVLWVLVFYMAGLYGKGTLLFKSYQPQALVKTQVFNIVLAALFFFLVPGVGITPKTNLAIYLVVSLVLIFIWRLALYPHVSLKRVRINGALIAEGSEANELVAEVNSNDRYHLAFGLVLTPDAFLALDVEERQKLFAPGQVQMVVADTNTEAIRTVQNLSALPCLQSGAPFVEFTDLYEEVFDRVPLSRVNQGWFLTYAPGATPVLYAFPKRIIDLAGGIAMGAVTIVATPVVFIALAIEGPGPLFIAQDRLGHSGKLMRVYKFRSMRTNKAASKEWTVEEKQDNPVTRVGSILRHTSLDEFPQFINILKGELSLIGPRNDIEGLGTRLAESIPYYMLRYSVTPGITGWAQINQQYEQGHISPQSIEETKVRLAYDFYYIKHRSLGLDLVIALKTLKRMFFRLSTW